MSSGMLLGHVHLEGEWCQACGPAVACFSVPTVLESQPTHIDRKSPETLRICFVRFLLSLLSLFFLLFLLCLLYGYYLYCFFDLYYLYYIYYLYHLYCLYIYIHTWTFQFGCLTWSCYTVLFTSFLTTLPETNIAPENRPSQ